MRLKTSLLVIAASALLLAQTAASAASSAEPPAPSGRSISTWSCQAFYLPARSIWPRTVAIESDGAVIRTVLIDGIAVYTFNVTGSTLMTAVDGERIQFDVEALTWTSDLRGLVSSSGRCVP